MALGPFYVAEKLKSTAGLRGVALFMRHGETAWNRDGRVMGRSPVDLDDEGREQVRGAVEFAKIIEPEIIITSPLARARQSAEIIAEGVGLNIIHEDHDLSEVLYGRWEGMIYDDLIDDPDYLKYRERPIDTPTPGGETIAQVQARGVAAVTRAMSANPGKRILFVSHGDIIRSTLAFYIGVELANFRRIRVDNATFSAVQIAGEFAEVKFLNLLYDPGRAFVMPFKSNKAKIEHH